MEAGKQRSEAGRLKSEAGIQALQIADLRKIKNKT